jgi:hypothetical protein
VDGIHFKRLWVRNKKEPADRHIAKRHLMLKLGTAQVMVLHESTSILSGKGLTIDVVLGPMHNSTTVNKHLGKNVTETPIPVPVP